MFLCGEFCHTFIHAGGWGTLRVRSAFSELFYCKSAEIRNDCQEEEAELDIYCPSFWLNPVLSAL